MGDKVREVMLATVIFLPMVWAIGLIPGGLRKPVSCFSPFTALPALFVALFFYPIEGIDISWLLIDTRLGMDDIGRVFLGFTSIIWLISGCYAYSYLGSNTRFFLFYLLTLSGNLGLIVSGDLVSFYTFFALMSFSAYGMIVNTGTKKAFYAGKVYIILVVIGEIALFSAFVLLAQLSGSLYLADLPQKIVSSPNLDLIMALLIGGFGIKAALFSLHVWLPLAHPVAPTPASAILSACMIKCGLLGWMRLFPLGDIALPEWGLVLIAFGLFAIFYAIFIGLFQDEVKTVLAYSSVSQMGYMIACIGAGLKNPDLWGMAKGTLLVYIVSHAFIKAAMFLSVAITARPLSWLVYYIGMWMPPLAIIGIPYTSGFAAKHLFKETLLASSEGSGYIFFLKVLLWGGSFATTLLMVRFLWLMGLKKEKAPSTKAGMTGSWLLLVLLMGGLTFILANKGVPLTGGLDAWLIPVSGLIVGIGVIKSGFKKPFEIAPGDLLCFYKALINRMFRHYDTSDS